MRTRVPRLGHALIDRQHARLAATAVALHAATVRGRPTAALLSRLWRDTTRHFASEDRLMNSIGYVDRIGHRRLHAGVLDAMLHMRQSLVQGLPLHRKHAAQILEWIAHHAAEADRHLVACLSQASRFSRR